MISVAALIWQENKILFARRDDSASQAHKWELPGGKCEAGETNEQSLARELEEELDMKGEVGKEMARTDFHHKNIQYTLVVLEFKPSKNISLADLPLRVHTEFKFMTINEALSLKSDFVESDYNCLLKIK